MNKFLFEEFDEVSAKQWKQKIQFDLKGADYNETLIGKSPEGIHIKPFYHQDDFDKEFSPVPGQPDRWIIVQKVFIDDEKIANELAIDSLSRGSEAILFQSDKEFDIPKVFQNFPFEKAEIYLELNFLSKDFHEELTGFFQEKNATVRFHIDVIGNLARTGNWFHNRKKDFEILKSLLSGKAANHIAIDASVYQNAGANIVQQLTYALAVANEYFNAFSEDLKEKSLTFKFATGSNYFFEIAKIRAFRKLFSILAKEYGAKEECYILSVPSKRNKTIYDYNVNLLRTTTECMSAVLGGANAVCNMAYDAIYHKSNEFGERISRNQLLILKEESYFEVVQNPADGTYYIESLTDELAEKALEIFKNIEKSGGFLKQLKEGIIQKKIKESASAEQELFDSGVLKLLGTNYHTNPNDRMKHDLELHPFVKKNKRKTIIEPVLEKRLSEESDRERLEKE